MDDCRMKISGFLRCGICIGIALMVTMHPSLRAQSGNASVMSRISTEWHARASDETFAAWVQENRALLSDEVITGFAERGMMQREDDDMAIALVLCRIYNNDGTTGDVYTFAGFLRYYTGRSGAEEYARNALDIFARIRRPIGQGNARLLLGQIAFMAARYDEATTQYDSARICYEKGQDIPGLAHVYRSLGDMGLARAYYAAADSFYILAIRFYNEVGDALGLGNSYNGRGNAALALGEFHEAQTLYLRSIRLFKNRPDPTGLGNAYCGLGRIADLSGNTTAADSLYLRSLDFYRQAGDPLGQGNVCVSLATNASMNGLHRRADSLFRAALILYQRDSNRLGLGNVWNGLGNIAYIREDNSRADSLYRLALNDYTSVGDVHGQGNVLWSLASISYLRGNRFAADSLFHRALDCFLRVGDRLGTGNVYLRLGIVRRETGDLPAAERYLRDALVQYGQYGQKNAAVVHGELAHVARLRGDSKQALQEYRAALDGFEFVRSHIIDLDVRKSNQETVIGAYEEYADYLAVLGRREESLAAADQMRARIFTELLTGRGQVYSKGVDQTLLSRRASLQTQIGGIARNAEGGTRTRDFAVNADNLRAQQLRLQAELNTVDSIIRVQSGALYLPPVSTAELQGGILHDNDVLLEFLVTADSTRAFIVTRDSFRMVTFGFGDSALAAAAVEDFPFLTARNPLDHRDDEIVTGDLYRMLIRPLEGFIPRNAHLIIVPDRFLAVVPFEGICTGVTNGKPEFLVERNTISYMQSAAVLRSIRQQQRPAFPENTLLAFGDPVYDYEHFRIGKPEYVEHGKGGDGAPLSIPVERSHLMRSVYLTASGKPLGRLKGSGEEATAVGELFPVEQRRVWLRADATEEHAMAPRLDRYRYILFSCHGLVSSTFQGLALSQFPDAPGDGILTLEEIMNSEYNAECVVLSACETGLGEIRRGEGVTGLTRGVMLAGSRSVLTSLWSVDDRGTKELMVRFFTKMVEGKDKRVALREAKLELLRSGTWKSPVFWAAFVLYGE